MGSNLALKLPEDKNQPVVAEEVKEKGDINVLRKVVVTFVIDEQYDRAIDELRAFLDKEFDYPNYEKKIQPYIQHAIDLVNAIKAKRKFPGIKSLTMAKQQELKEKYHQHFEELQAVLDRIERVYKQLQASDVRSTSMVLKAIVNGAFAIAFVAFAIEWSRGQLGNAMIVMDDYITDIVEFFSRFF